MPLASGTRLGPYEILAPIGAGGMGEVYRARDTRLGRDVAVKVLPADFASDPDRLRRFELEARAAGSLNHPNILTIHDIGTHDGAPYVVSELLEGETLRGGLAERPLPARKAIEYAIQMASGLAAAHDKGIAHRDLKPENLFLTTDSRLKILDFGLAKLLQIEAPSEGATAAPTSPLLTQPGTVMGTPGYMSPEQARGERVDHRGDLFTFGAILQEMLTGERAFRGATAIESMHAILIDDPTEALEANPNVSPALLRIVRHCLEKNPAQRFQSAQDLGFALNALSETTVVLPRPAAPPVAVAWRRRVWPAMAALAALLVLAGAFLLGRRQSPPELSFKRLTYRRGTITAARFAQGGAIVYSASWDGVPVDVFTARPDSPESRSLGLSTSQILSVSSSGEMALLQGFESIERVGVLAQAPLAGGAPRQVLEGVRFADWAPDGSTLAVSRRVQGRLRIEFPVGKTLYETANLIGDMRVSPKGDRIAFAERPDGFGTQWSIAVVDRSGSKRTLPGEWLGGDMWLWLAWSPDGDEIWFTAGVSGDDTLHAVSLAGQHRVLARFPVLLQLQDVSRDGRVLANRVNFQGGCAGRPPGEERERNLSWLDGSEIDDISQDARTLLMTEYGEGGDSARGSVYLRKLDGSPAVRLGEGYGYALSPDGKWALSMRRGAPPQLVLLPTGPGTPVLLERGNIGDFGTGDWLPDGKWILFTGAEPGHLMRCYLQDVAGGAPRPVSPEGVRFRGGAQTVSPDGAWFVAMDEQGKSSLYPIDGGEPRPLPGLRRGDAPSGWSADERALFVFRHSEKPGAIYRVDLASGQNERWLPIALADPAGIVDIWGVALAPDEKSYYYSYQRNLTDLYLIEGVK